MKRHAPFEPPEYLDWQPDDELLREYRATLDRDPKRAEVIRRLSPTQLLDMYSGLVRNRLADIALKRMVRQGVISKAWLGTGEEASTVGPVHALRRPKATPAAQRASCDMVAPMIRNAGAVPRDGDAGGGDAARVHGHRGRSDARARRALRRPRERRARADQPRRRHGAGGDRRRDDASRCAARDRVAITWIGDGSAKTGVAHEGLNFAAVQKVPAVFIIQNNQVALGTRLDQHHLAAAGEKFAQWPKAYGMWGGVFDGNNVLDAYALTALAVERCRRGEGPALLVAETFRMGGHATHDEAEARRTFDASLFAHWGKRDPIGMFEEHLVRTGISRERLAQAERRGGGGGGRGGGGGDEEPGRARARGGERARRGLCVGR